MVNAPTTTTAQLPQPFSSDTSNDINWKRSLGIGASAGVAGAGLASLFGSGSGGGGYEDASKIYQDYLNKAMGELHGHEAQGRGDIEQHLKESLGFEDPYRQAGTGALQDYQATLGEGGPGSQQSVIDKFRASPGYKFALEQGLKSTQRGMASRGMVGSGAEMRELQRTGQGMADQEYGQYQNRLSNLATMGQQSAARGAQQTYGAGGALANLGVGYGGQMANLYGSMGKAQADALMAQKLAEAKQKGSLWQGIGSGIGALAHFIPGL